MGAGGRALPRLMPASRRERPRLVFAARARALTPEARPLDAGQPEARALDAGRTAHTSRREPFDAGQHVDAGHHEARALDAG
jgi:hypothetical protein